MHETLHIKTQGPGLYDFTERLPRCSGDGLLHLFVRHTSCSLLIQENADPSVQVDLLAWLQRCVPRATDPSMHYLTHTFEGADDMPAHIKAALLPVSLTIPYANGALLLGTWQGVYLFEHRDRAQTRQVIVTKTT